MSINYIKITTIVTQKERGGERERGRESERASERERERERERRPSYGSDPDCSLLIIVMDICKASTLRLKALNKHNMTHIMSIDIENVISNLTKANT